MRSQMNEWLKLYYYLKPKEVISEVSVIDDS